MIILELITNKTKDTRVVVFILLDLIIDTLSEGK
jgi:hypothetical protein